MRGLVELVPSTSSHAVHTLLPVPIGDPEAALKVVPLRNGGPSAVKYQLEHVGPGRGHRREPQRRGPEAREPPPRGSFPLAAPLS